MLNKTKIKNLFCVRLSFQFVRVWKARSSLFHVDKTINSRFELIYTLVYTIAAVCTVKTQFENVTKQTNYGQFEIAQISPGFLLFLMRVFIATLSMLSELFRCVQFGSSNLYFVFYFNKIFEFNKGGIHSLLLL